MSDSKNTRIKYIKHISFNSNEKQRTNFFQDDLDSFKKVIDQNINSDQKVNPSTDNSIFYTQNSLNQEIKPFQQNDYLLQSETTEDNQKDYVDFLEPQNKSKHFFIQKNFKNLTLNEQTKTVTNENFPFGKNLNSDTQENQIVQRVIRKSIFVLCASVLSFSLLVVIGLNLFFLSSNLLNNLLLAILLIGFFVSTTNIFFIVLADKNYLWLNLIAQVVCILFFHSFLGQGFSFITLITSLLIAIFSYLAYSELEKIQLGSRLFSIGNITSESARTLTTAAILVLCLGIFNQIVFTGTKDGVYLDTSNFFSKVFLENDFIMDKIIIGENTRTSLNRYIMNGYYVLDKNTNQVNTIDNITANTRQAIFRDFLADNYQNSKPLLSISENEDIKAKCLKEKIQNCDQKIEEFKNIRIEEWKNIAYKNLNLDLQTPLNKENFKEISKQYYINLIKSFSQIDNQNNNLIPVDIPSLQTKYILPIVFVILIYLLFNLLKPFINLLNFLLTWIIWFFLKKTGFAKVEVETVEAEIVSI